MGFDWKKTIGTIAPGIATALGGPVAGFATKALCGFFGLDEDANDIDTQIEQAVKGMTPEQAIQFKALDQQFVKDMKKLDVDVFKLEVDDRKSARKMYEKASKTPQLVLGLLIVLGVSALIWAIIAGKVAGNVDATIVGTILGFAISEFRQLTGFFFGSSMGSKEKNGLLASKIQETGK